jgi:ketosteroid isomerase-like protein
VVSVSIQRPEDLHPAVKERFNAGDVDGLADLYEVNAVIVGPDGEHGEGHDAIRANWAALLEMGGTAMSMTTVYCIERGDLALLRNNYTLDLGGALISGSTAEVARRQPDGTWRYVIDNPFGANPVA